MEQIVIKFYDDRQPHIDNLNKALCTYNWSHLTIDRDINIVYITHFSLFIEWHINLFVPHQTRHHLLRRLLSRFFAKA